MASRIRARETRDRTTRRKPARPATPRTRAPRPLDLDAFFHRVDAAYRTDPRGALALVDRALATPEATGEGAAARLTARMRLIRMRGHVRRALNDFAGALDDYRRVLAYYWRTGNRLEAAITEIGRVDALMYRGRYAEALRAAEAARRVFLDLGEGIRAARLDCNVGNLYHRWDRPAEALKHYDRARRTFAARKDRPGLALVDFNRGNALSVLGRFVAAEAAYGAARASFSALGQEMAVAQVDYNRAYLPFLEERLTEALAAFDEVQPRLGRLGDRRHEALCLMDTAEILLRLNLPIEAEERARRAAAGFRALEMRYEQGRSIAFQGMALFRLRRLDRARAIWRRASTLFAREKNRVWLGVMALGLARLELLAGRRRAALARAVEAERWFGRAAPPDRRAECLLVRGLLDMDRPGAADARRARQRLIRALGLARRAGAIWLQRDVHEALGDLARAAGRRTQARTHYEAAVNAGEELRALVAGDDFRAAFFRDRSRPYLNLAFLDLETGRTDDAWRWVERSRARALVEEMEDLPRLAPRAARPGATELEALLRRLAAQYHGDVERHAIGSRPGAGVSRLPDTVRRHLESRAETLVGRLYPNLRRAPKPSAGARRPDPAPGVRPGEALITYVELDGAISAFVTTSRGLSVATDLVDTATVRAAADRLAYQWGRFRLGNALFKRHARLLMDDTLEDLALLNGLLLAPLRSAAEASHWILSPSRSMAALPFAAFHDGAEFLIEAHTLSVTPSLGVLTRCRERVGRGGRCALLLGQTGPSTPEVGRELDQLSRALKGQVVRRLEGPAATLEAYQREAGEAAYIHLTSHGFFHTERPRLSGIRLADRWLHAHDVVRQPLKAELVVLSACQSGLSLALEGEEWLGLPRAFLKAGAASVLASLWDVDDRATRVLMGHFIEAWRGGTSGGNRAGGRVHRPASEALRAAQRAVLAGSRHPYFWAGFQLVGAP